MPPKLVNAHKKHIFINKNLYYGLVFAVILGWACSPKKLTITTVSKSTVSLVDPNNLQEQGEIVSGSPATIEIDRLGNRFIKITAPEKVTQYLLVTDTLGTETKANLRLLDIEKAGGNDNQDDGPQNDSQGKEEAPEKEKLDLNLTHRLLLKAYRAITRRDYNSASALADKISQLAPDLAAPHIVKGIAQLKQGQNANAISSFNQAKALDPQDIELDKLLKAAEK